MASKKGNRQGMEKRFLSRKIVNKDFKGNIFNEADLKYLENDALIRGVDLTRLLNYLGSSGMTRDRDIKDLMEITELDRKRLESLNKGRRLISWGTIKLIAAWADIYAKDCINILVNGEKPPFIRIDYTTCRLNLREVLEAKEVDIDVLENVFGRNWAVAVDNISKGKRRLSVVELNKVADLTGFSYEELLRFCGFY